MRYYFILFCILLLGNGCFTCGRRGEQPLAYRIWAEVGDKQALIQIRTNGDEDMFGPECSPVFLPADSFEIWMSDKSPDSLKKVGTIPFAETHLLTNLPNKKIQYLQLRRIIKDFNLRETNTISFSPSEFVPVEIEPSNLAIPVGLGQDISNVAWSHDYKYASYLEQKTFTSTQGKDSFATMLVVYNRIDEYEVMAFSRPNGYSKVSWHPSLPLVTFSLINPQQKEVLHTYNAESYELSPTLPSNLYNKYLTYNAPAWANNGEYLAFFAIGSDMNISWLNVQNNTIAYRKVKDYNYSILWNQNSSRFYYVDSQARHYDFATQTHTKDNLSVQPSRLLAISPDEQKLVYISDASGKPTIWVENLTTHLAYQLNTEAFLKLSSFPSFNATGDKLLVATRKEKNKISLCSVKVE